MVMPVASEMMMAAGVMTVVAAELAVVTANTVTAKPVTAKTTPAAARLRRRDGKRRAENGCSGKNERVAQRNHAWAPFSLGLQSASGSAAAHSGIPRKLRVR
jgi:hypothetical protein